MADLAQSAADGDAHAFLLLREQVFEYHRLGIAAGEDVLAAASPEVTALAEEICAAIRRADSPVATLAYGRSLRNTHTFPLRLVASPSIGGRDLPM